MKNILIIEDSKIINHVISKEMQRLGFFVDKAYTLEDARGYLKINQYDLIILDLHLPDGEGSELIANIQSLTKTKVVILTSSQDEDLREELFQYGIVDYLVKDKNLLYSLSEIIKIIKIIDATGKKSKDKILIIDDSKFICKQVTTVLEPRNYIVTSTYDGASGIEKVKKENFNLLILDMELPDMHGLEVLEIIRKDPELLDIPIVVLSGTATPDIIRNVLKNGANDFLKKPFVFEEFILKVDLWIDYFKNKKELSDKTTKLNAMNENLHRLVKEEVHKNYTKDKIMFAQSRHAQMGEMISMIAHQWRQPLNIISTASSIINHKIQKDNLSKVLVNDLTLKISKNIEYLSDTIDDFRNFFKLDKKMIVSDFNIVIEKSLVLIKSSIEEKKIELDVEIKSIEKFNSYENELIQVVLNILKNSEDVLIEKKIQNPKISICINNRVLSILDNGGGIQQDYIDKIFDPYFSTKKEKEGTGLGLYMSKIIIDDHCCGKLEIQNTQEGAKFIISLPKNKCDVDV